VQLRLKRLDQGVHRLFDAALGLADVLALDALGVQLGVSLQQFERGGQVILHKLAHARQFFGVGLGLLKNLGRDRFQPADLVAHLLIGDGVVDVAQLVEVFLVLVFLGLGGFFGFGLALSLFRLGGFALHHQVAAAHVEEGLGAKDAVVDAVLQIFAAFFVA